MKIISSFHYFDQLHKMTEKTQVLTTSTLCCDNKTLVLQFYIKGDIMIVDDVVIESAWCFLLRVCYNNLRLHSFVSFEFAQVFVISSEMIQI